MKAFRLSLYLLLTFAGLGLLYLCAAFSLHRITHPKRDPQMGNIPIYIITNGAHTDVVVPVKNDCFDWLTLMPYANTLQTDTSYQWLALGWGDKGFYMEIADWNELTPRIAVRAAFGIGTTAIHATFYQKMMEGDDCVKMLLTPTEYHELIAYITKSLQKNAQGQLLYIPTKAVYGDHDAFYEAEGSYSLFHTCNTWTNNALKSCGQKACFWTAFDEGIFYQYTK